MNDVTDVLRRFALSALLAAAALLAPRVCAGGGPASVVGRLEWPSQWHVFGPLDQSDPVLPAETLSSVPSRIEVSGKTLTAQVVDVADGRFDFAPLLGGTEAGRTAYAFLTLDSPQDGAVTLGMGADWWMQVWVDGRLICDTTADGNGLWPPSSTNFTRTVRLSKGKHVLAVRFVSGAGSSVLALGGPDQLRNTPAPLWAQARRIQSPPLGAETVPNGGFERGDGDPWVPSGWTNPSGAQGYAPGELAARVEAPLSGQSTLEVNTLAGQAGVRRLYTRLSLLPGTLHRIAYKARHLAGGYVSISLRAAPDSGQTYFLAGGTVSQGHKGEYTGYHYIEDPRPYLVIETRGPARALLDELSIRRCPDGSKKYASWTEQRFAWGADWDRITPDVATPAVPIARPHVAGTLRILSLRPRWEQRWVAELAQRFDVEYHTVMFEQNNAIGRDYWVRDADGLPVLLDVLQSALSTIARPADCIILSRLSASAIPARLVTALLERVRAGTGLVITGFRQPFYPYPDGRGDEALEKYKQGLWSAALAPANVTDTDTDTVRLGSVENAKAEFYQHGNGRIAYLRYAEVEGVTLRSQEPDNPKHRFEAEMSYVMKAALWASRRAPTCRIADMALPSEAVGSLPACVARSSLPGVLTVGVSDDTAARAGERMLTVEIRNRHGLAAHSDRVSVPREAGTVRVRIPQLPGGVYHVTLRLLVAGRVADWTVAVLKVTADPSVERIVLQPAPPYFRRGDRICGKAMLSAPVNPDDTVRLTLTDADGNLWHSEVLAGSGPEFSFQVPTDILTVLSHRLSVQLSRAGAVVDEACIDIVVVPANDTYLRTFDFQIWQLSEPDYLGLLLTGVAARDLGFTSVVYPGHGPSKANARNCVWHNIRATGGICYYPGGQNQLAGDPAYAPERKPCLTSPSLRNALNAVTRKWSLRGLEYGLLAYATDHEQNLLGCTSCLKPDADVCFSPTCLAHFREFLQTEYRDVQAVNACWGTPFTGWDEVTPMVLDEAIRTSQIPRWIDHRRHMDRVWTDFTTYKLEVLRASDPHAQGIIDNVRSGETTLSSFNGIDYWQLLSEAVGGAALPMSYLTSFVPPERQHLVWLRGSAWHPDDWTCHRDLFQARFASRPWQALFRGASGYTYWAHVWGAQPCGNVMSPVWPDLRTTYLGQAASAAVAQIHTGIARLLMEGRRDDSGIALYYSRSSEHVCTAWQALHDSDTARELDPRSCQFRFFAPCLRAAGREFRSLAYAQVARGDLRQTSVRLLILPFAQAISGGECEEIRAFVEAGGTLLADIRPAVCDEHGKPSAAGGLLDDVFGVRHAAGLADFAPSRGAAQIRGGLGGQAFGLDLAGVILGPKLTLTTARALGSAGDTQVLTVNSFGKGKALLLNFSVTDREPNAVPLGELMDAVLADAGIERLFGLEVLDEVWFTGAGEELRLTEPVAPRQALGVPADGGSSDPGEVEGIGTTAPARSVPTRVRVTNGDIECLAIWFNQRRGRGLQRLRLTPPRRGYVYDLLTNQRLGKKSRFEIRLPLEGLAAYAVTPYALRKPTLDVRVGRARGGHVQLTCTAEVRPRAAAAQKHVVRFRLRAPDGTEWRSFSVTAVAQQGVARHTFDLPLSAARGQWVVSAREAISGLTDRAAVRLD